MLAQLVLLLASVGAAPIATSAPIAQPTTAATETPDASARLLEKIVAVCASHPEVERAFLLSKPGPSGTEYMFIPIFDRKVSDEAIAEADKAHKEVFPAGSGLGLMLLARNSWKKTLAGIEPVYVRPKG